MNTIKSKYGNQTCVSCDGNGFFASINNKCNFCEGRGFIKYEEYKKIIDAQNTLERENRILAMKRKIIEDDAKAIEDNNNWDKSRVICSHCGGDGGATGQCFRCHGSGWETLK